MLQSRLVIACLVGGLLSSSIVACGDDKETASQTTGSVAGEVPKGAVPPNILTETDVKAQPEGSPSRALLEWAQAIQFSDPDGVAALSSPEAIRGMGGQARLEKAVGFMGSGFSRITIASVQNVDDTHARVRSWLSTYDTSGKRTAFTPSTFALVKVDGGWKLENLNLVARTLRDFEALERSKQ